MIGRITKISESAFGGDILTIETDGDPIESFGFINGQDGIVFVEGDTVQFTPKFFNLSNRWRATEVERYDFKREVEIYIESCNQLEGVKL